MMVRLAQSKHARAHTCYCARQQKHALCKRASMCCPSPSEHLIMHGSACKAIMNPSSRVQGRWKTHEYLVYFGKLAQDLANLQHTCHAPSNPAHA